MANSVPTKVLFPQKDMLMEELDEFARCVRGEMLPETDATTGLNALALIRGAGAAEPYPLSN